VGGPVVEQQVLQQDAGEHRDERYGNDRDGDDAYLSFHNVAVLSRVIDVLIRKRQERQ